MKKYINIAFVYAIAALCCGVFYREFTKYFGFTGRTALAFSHVHLFVMGTIMFLVIAIFCRITNLEEQKSFGRFMKWYNFGLPFMVVMFLVRGVTQVMETPLSKAASASISGIAGIAHIILAIAIVLLFQALKKAE